MAAKTLSPEEYVTSLYRTLLKREPDDEGLKHHVTELRRHKDYAQTFNVFINSDEYKQVDARKHHGVDAPAFGFSFEAQDPFDTEMIIECSWGHFDDLSFIENIARRSAKFGRKLRKIKKIAVYYPKMSNGGTERVTARQILAWTSLGYEVILLTDHPADPWKDYDYGNVERIVIPGKMMHNQDYRPRGKALAEILTERGVDLFVNNLWDETSTVWDVLVAKSLDIPVVVGWHNIFDTRIRSPQDLHLANMRFAGYRYADLVTVLSTVDALWFRTRNASARVVYNPLTFNALPARTAPLDGKTIIWVARAERHQKRLDLAIRMFPIVLQKVPDARLLIVGGGPDLVWAKEYARSLGIARQVEFVGYTTNVAEYLARADVHILTSEFEGWCLALGEAWAYGLPSVMFELPYLEYVQSGKGYIPVEMHDISAMAAAVAKLLLDEDLRKTMGRQAREVIEEFDQVSVAEEWRKIFLDIETCEDLNVPLSPAVELRGQRALVRVLGDRFLNLERPQGDGFMPLLPSQAPLAQPRKASTRKLMSIAEVVSAPVETARRSYLRRLLPDPRLRMIDLSHVGLGDNIMIWTGLFTLLDNGVPLCAEGCVMHVQPLLADMASSLFARFGLIIQRGRPAEQISPLYSPLPPQTRSEWWNTYIGRDWRMNWVEALDLQKSFPRQGADLSFAGRIRLQLSERLLYRRHSWAEATPGYIGYRVWLPLALRHGVYPLVFMTQLKRSLHKMRAIVAGYVDSITPEPDRERYMINAAFPTGKSFQTIPPKVYQKVDQALGGDFFACFIQNDSPWLHDYEAAGITPASLPNIQETLRFIHYAEKLLTTDSFTSHVAQLLRDDFTVVLSRDLKEGILHPGATPNIVANHPACAPCNYQERYHFDRCVAGYHYCVAFEDDNFVDRIAATFRG